jgi:hypothetical protein
MASALTETLSGTCGLAPQDTVGPSLKCGVYTATKVTMADWAVFGDFTAIYYCLASTVSAGAYTDEQVTVDATTTNQVTFESATTGALKIMVIGY